MSRALTQGPRMASRSDFFEIPTDPIALGTSGEVVSRTAAWTPIPWGPRMTVVALAPSNKDMNNYVHLKTRMDISFIYSYMIYLYVMAYVCIRTKCSAIRESLVTVVLCNVALFRNNGSHYSVIVFFVSNLTI